MGVGRDCSPWRGPFQQPGAADGKAARTKEPAPAVGVEGRSPALGPEPDQTVQAGPADTLRAKGHTAALWQGQLTG